MEHKNKELLLKDLSARLPYHTIVSTGEEDLELVKVDILNEKVYLFSESTLEFDVFEIKPYLRPMSSMTEEEKEEWYKESYVDYDCEFKPTPTLTLEHCHLSTDWLLAHHFDFRGLISLGLAIEAPTGMY